MSHGCVAYLLNMLLLASKKPVAALIPPYLFKQIRGPNVLQPQHEPQQCFCFPATDSKSIEANNVILYCLRPGLISSDSFPYLNLKLLCGVLCKVFGNAWCSRLHCWHNS